MHVAMADLNLAMLVDSTPHCLDYRPEPHHLGLCSAENGTPCMLVSTLPTKPCP